MSLEFNRRSFLKYSAAAAVVVAGSGLLTGCGDDEYQPTGTLGSTLSLMGKYTMDTAKVAASNATIVGNTTIATVESASPDTSNNTYTLVCNLDLKCTSKFGLRITRDNFQIEVTPSGSSTITKYHPGNPYSETDSTSTGGVFLTQSDNYLYKDDTLSTLLYVKNIKLQAGDTVKIKFWPRPQASEGSTAYTRAFVTWTVKVAKEDDKMVITKK